MKFKCWPQTRSRFIFSRRDVRGIDAPLASATKDGVLLRDDLNISVWNPESNVSSYKLVEPDDFVIGLRSFQHGISHSSVRGIVSPAYTVLRGQGAVDPRFYRHYFRSSLFISQLANLTQGIRQGQSIDIEAFANLRMLVPPREEQRRIANFLDFETSRIDRLRELQTNVHKRVQTREATKLDIEIEELGRLHGVRQFRRSIRFIEQGVSPQCDNLTATEEEWGVLKVSAVKNGAFYASENKRLPEEIEPEIRYEVNDGDLLITRANTPQLVGAAAVAKLPRRRLLLCDKVFRVSTGADLLPDFLVLVSMTKKIRDMCAEASHGTSQSMANLKTEEIKRWPVPMAPLSTQLRTVKEFMEVHDQTRKLTDSIDQQLRLLAERRQALITAAVTGQIDVTTARGLPEVDGVAV